MRVLEGAVTWTDLQQLDIDEIDWLYKQAEKINDKLSGELHAAKGRGKFKGG